MLSPFSSGMGGGLLFSFNRSGGRHFLYDQCLILGLSFVFFRFGMGLWFLFKCMSRMWCSHEHGDRTGIQWCMQAWHGKVFYQQGNGRDGVKGRVHFRIWLFYVVTQYSFIE